MPYIEKVISLAAVLDGSEAAAKVAAAGNRINAVSVTDITAGASFQIKIGNNPPASIRDQTEITIGNLATAADAQQGVTVVNPTAQAGATATLVISYSRPGEKGGAGAAITFGRG